MSTSQGPRPFKLTLKKSGSVKAPSSGGNAASAAGAPAQGNHGGSAGAPSAPPAGPPRQPSILLKGASKPVGPRPAGTGQGGARLTLKGQGHAAPTGTAAPSSSTSGVTRRLVLKGQASIAAAAPATPRPSRPAGISQHAMDIALQVQQEAEGTATIEPRTAAAAQQPRPAAAASNAASTAPRKSLGIKLKGASSGKPTGGLGAAQRRPASFARHAANWTAAAGAPAPSAASPVAAKPRITLNKSRGPRPAGAAGAGGSAYADSGCFHQQHQQQPAAASDGLAGAYNAPSQPTAEHGFAEQYAASVHDYSAAAAAAVPYASQGYDYDYVTAGNGSLYGDYSGAGQKRQRPPAAGNRYSKPAAEPKPKKPKLAAAYRDSGDEDADEDFNPKAERVQQRFAAAAAAARQRAGGGSSHRPGHPKSWAKGAGARAAGAARAAAAARHAATQAAQRAAAAAQHAAAAAAAVPATAEQPAADMPMSAADAAAAFARMTSTAHGAAAFGIAPVEQNSAIAGHTAAAAAAAPGQPAAAATAAAPAPAPAPAPQVPINPAALVDPVLLQELESIPETYPATREALAKLVAAVEKRDKYKWFANPVTDAVAPNYSKVIKNPMDLSTMRSKVEKGAYKSWSDIQADLILMFVNAKTYNAAKSLVHKQADLLLTASLKLLKNFKQGKTKVRGFTGNVPTGGHPAPAAAAAGGSGGATTGAGGSGSGSAAVGVGNAAPSGALAAAAGGGSAGDGAAKKGPSEKKKAAGGSGSGIRAGGGSGAGPGGNQSVGVTTRATRHGRRKREEEAPVAKRPRTGRFIALQQGNAADYSTSTQEGDTFRDTFRSKLIQHKAAAWGGLADGANPEGVAFGVNGRPVLRCVAGHIHNLPPELYLKSISRFVAGAGQAVERLVTSLLGTNLQQLIPIKGVTPSQLPQQQTALQRQQQHVPGPAAAGARLLATAAVGLAGAQGVPQLQNAQQQQFVLQQQQWQQQMAQQRQQQQQSLASSGPMSQGSAVAARPQAAAVPAQNQYAALIAAQQQQQQQQLQHQFVPGPHMVQTASQPLGMQAMPQVHSARVLGLQGLAGVQGLQAGALPVGITQQRT